MKLTKQRLIEIIKEEIQDLNESPMGRAQMYAKGMSKDALRLLTYLKKGDVEKAKYFIKDIQDALKQIEKNAVNEGILNEIQLEAEDIQDMGAAIFDVIIEFKKNFEKSDWKKNRKINSIIKQLLKLEQQLSDETQEF